LTSTVPSVTFKSGPTGEGPAQNGAELEMQETKERVQRFIEAFERVYGRKPKQDDAEGNFKLQVAQDMQMSVGGARYYLRLAVTHKEEEAT